MLRGLPRSVREQRETERERETGAGLGDVGQLEAERRVVARAGFAAQGIAGGASQGDEPVLDARVQRRRSTSMSRSSPGPTSKSSSSGSSVESSADTSSSALASPAAPKPLASMRPVSRSNASAVAVKTMRKRDSALASA